MNKKTLTALLAFASALCLCFNLSACSLSGTGGSIDQGGDHGGSQGEQQGGEQQGGDHGGSQGGGQGGEGHVHHFEYVYNNNATCTEDGTETERCECGARGETRVKEGSKLGHDMVQLAAQTATCSECGYPAHIGCSRCGYTEEDITYTDALHVEYTLLEGHYSVTGLDKECTDSEIKIPSVYEGHPVTEFRSWVRYRSSPKSIIIPASVTSIGEGMFYGCESLTNVTFEKGSNLTSIGMQAFAFCSSLTSIIIPEGVTSIKYMTFSDCSSLTNITIPESVTSIEDFAFDGCSSLTSITIPESVTSIGSAFRDCSLLSSIVIPEGVTSIGGGAFKGTAYYENSANWINDILYIGDYLISTRDTISGACNIREGTKLIAESAFSGCRSLTSITIPDSVAEIGYAAFYNCSLLSGITIPDSVTSIEDFAFAGCSSLESIEVAQGNPVYHSNRDCLIETESKTLILGCKNSVIPNDGSVTSIGNAAFALCNSLESITIPESVTTIGESAFLSCSSLTSIVIPEGVTSIEDFAFSNCDSLQSIVIPEGVTSIGENAFMSCDGLTSIVIPEGVTSIGENAFSGCDSLQSIVIPNSVTSIGASAFRNCSSLEVYYGGTKEDWASIDISSSYYNYYLTDATRYYFSETEPSEEQWTEWDYWWHFDEETGEAVEWKKN